MKNFILISLLLAFFAVETVANDKTEVMKVSRQAVLALKGKNFAKLAVLVHPVKGVRFSAYSYIDKEHDLVFKKTQIAGLWGSKKIYSWGEYDGSGDPIKMRFAKYYAHFIYDRDFARAPRIEYNTQLGGGNTVVNIRAAYPKGKFVEYYFPDSQDGGAMNWNSCGLSLKDQAANGTSSASLTTNGRYRHETLCIN
jgi:hypothetical protein